MELKFLIVDNSVTMRRIIINSLRNMGYLNFVEASDGEEGLIKIKCDDTINFIITEWDMPVLTGLQLTKAVRADDEISSTPVLMVTTRSIKRDIIEAWNAQVSAYIVKPFTQQVLKDKIEHLLTLNNIVSC